MHALCFENLIALIFWARLSPHSSECDIQRIAQKSAATKTELVANSDFWKKRKMITIRWLHVTPLRKLLHYFRRPNWVEQWRGSGHVCFWTCCFAPMVRMDTRFWLKIESAPWLNLSFFHSPTTAAVGQQHQMSLSETGKDAYLPCGNVKGCDQIQWWFRASQYSMPVQIPPPLPGSTLTNRQICWRDCTLAVLRVQEKDAGRYICTQQMKELVQIDLIVVTGKYQSQFTDAEEQCSFPP